MEIKEGVLYGKCERNQIQGEFNKSFCFRFMTAIILGGNDYKYNVDIIHEHLIRVDNQFGTLMSFAEYANSHSLERISAMPK